MSQPIIVFLGPTLSQIEAKQHLPTADYHPPVKCGDIMRLIPSRPAAFVIIDGYFENTPAVWHKEILCALDQGITVIGASSMGALRAAELAPFGMQGVGDIFDGFATGRLNDDDEVAVLHAPKDGDYQSLSDAMVNIRATLACALRQNIIQQPTHDKLIQTCKTQFYQKRSLASALQQINTSDETQQLQKWLDAGNSIDLKKADAILCLQKVQQGITTPSTIKANTPPTVFLRALQRSNHNNEGSSDKHLQEKALKLGRPYRLSKRLAFTLEAAYALAKPSIKITGNSILHWKNKQTEQSYFTPKDCEQFEQRLNTLNHFIASHRSQITNFEDTQCDYALNLVRLTGEYQRDMSWQSYQQKNPHCAAVIDHIACLHVIIDHLLSTQGFITSQENLQYYFHDLRLRLKLFTEQDITLWLEENNLNDAQLSALLHSATRFKTAVLQGEYSHLQHSFTLSLQPWLLDALRLTDCYSLIFD